MIITMIISGFIIKAVLQFGMEVIADIYSSYNRLGGTNYSFT